jgi:hypothetical protein
MRVRIFFGVGFVLLFLLGLVIGSVVQDHRNTVSYFVSIPKGAKVTAYKDVGGDGPYQYDSSKPLLSLSSSQKITTKTGVYDFVISDSSSYATNVVQTTVNKATASVAVNPDLSDKSLNSLLSINSSQITASLFSSVRSLSSYYSVDKIALYQHGDWAGVTLKPLSPRYDPIRFVLHKDRNGWRVINTPSILVIGSANKTIPPDVVSSVNSM